MTWSAVGSRSPRSRGHFLSFIRCLGIGLVQSLEQRGPLALEEGVHVVQVLQPRPRLRWPIGEEGQAGVNDLARGTHLLRAALDEAPGCIGRNVEVLASIARFGAAADEAGLLEDAGHAAHRAAARTEPLGNLRRPAFGRL